MAALTPTALRLIVTPDPRTLLTNEDVSLTATSEAGPRPGIVTADQTTAAVFQASGTLDSELEDYVLSIARSGGPGAVEMRWRHNDGSESARGWDPPTAISEWAYIARSTTASKYTTPHACRRTSGLLVVVVTDAAAAITCFRQSAAGLWTSSTVATVANSKATICELPGGRLLCAYLQPSTATTQVHTTYSDDGGATWSQATVACLASRLLYVSTDIARIRMGVLGTDITMIIWGYAANLHQYASSDLGCTFQLIDTLSGTAYRANDLTVRGGVAYWAYITTQSPSQPDPATHRPYVGKYTTAGSALSAVEAVYAWSGTLTAWDGAAGAEEELAILADDDGTLTLFGRDADTAGGSFREVFTTVSTDGGVTWAKTFKSSANNAGLSVASWGVSTSYLLDFCVVPERGRAALIHRSVAVTATDDDSLMVSWLGGWSDLNMPADTSYDRPLSVGGWNMTWLGFEKPAGVGWTRATTGAPTETLTSAGMAVSVAAAEANTYVPLVAPTAVVGLAAAPNAGIMVTGLVQVISGSATVTLRSTDATDAFSVRLEVTATSIKLWDVAAAGYIAGGVTTTDAVDGISFLLCIDAPNGYGVGQTGRARCYYRNSGATASVGPLVDREWTTITNPAAGYNGLVRIAGTATSLLQWGAGTTGAATLGGFAGNWRWFGWSAGTYIAGADGLADPTRGRVVPDRTSPVHIEKGLRLAMTSGPALVGQTFAHATDHDYPVEAVDVSFAPSPRRTWRSTDDGTLQDITLTCDAGWRAGDLVALWIGGANWRTAALYQDAGAAVKVMDVDMGVTGLDFTRTKNLIYSAKTGTALPWYASEGALDGSTFVLSAGVRRKVRHNRGGQWPGAAGIAPLTELELEDYDAGDPASGTGAVLWMPNALFLTTLLTSTTKLTLRIAVDVTADGYHETGCVMVGRGNALGRQYGWGRAVETLTSVDLKTLRGGARRANQQAPNREAIEIDWQSGVDQTGRYTASAPSWVSIYTGGDAHGDVPGVLPLVAGLLGETKGSTLPVVLCSRVPTQGSAPTSAAPIRVIDPNVLLYGRMMSETWRRDNIMGEEGTDYGEVMRGGVLRIEEEI